MMKVCILSMQKVSNFGSLLQSYALKSLLENLGHEVKFIDIEKNDEENSLITGHKLDYTKECLVDNKLISKLKKIDKYVFNRLHIKKLQKRQEKLFDDFRRENLINANPQEKFDYCVIGSDEVFNCLSKSKWGFTTQLFGNVRQAKNVITYAASCGYTTIDKLPIDVKNLIIDTFKNVKAFSVRDDNTFKFVQELTENDISFNSDPVIACDFANEICEYDIKLPKKYCIVYSYYNRINSKAEIKAIKSFCKKNKLTIVSVGCPQKWIKNHLVLKPFEIIKVFQNAEFVVTDTFHGTIFSARWAKKFMSIIRESNKNKMTSLVKLLKLEKHLAKDIAEIDEIYNRNKDYLEIDNICSFEREKSVSYLKKSIK